MKHILYIPIISLIASSSGCQKIPENDFNDTRNVSVEVAVRADDIASAPRSADENTIRNLNFYLYDVNGKICLHRYQTSPTLRFECRPGSYRLRVAANLGGDSGDNPSPEDFTVPHADDYEVLPMAWEGDITIPSVAGGVLTLPPIEVERCVAKISYEISVAPGAEGIELHFVRPLSIPREVGVFDTAATPSDDPDDYTDGKAIPLSGTTAAGTFYLLPNPQGTVPMITDQRDKNRENAPEHASHLMIRAVRGAKVLTYNIYLGENNTSDFNVHANTHYRFNISILGDDEVDMRVAAYSVTAEDDFARDGEDGYCTYRATNRLRLHVESRNTTPELTGRIELVEGDGTSFRFKGTTGALHTFDVENAEGLNSYAIAYVPALYTSGNHRLRYRLTVADACGFSQTYDFDHLFADLLTVYSDASGGEIAVEGALHTALTGEGNIRGTKALTLEEGCRLYAESAAGYRFEGWYADIRYTQCLSRAERYDFRPVKPRSAIYARFLDVASPLDGQGTANSYIAPEPNTGYSFDASVQGNGRATTGIAPEPLAGVRAEVLWETGSVRGAVVKRAQYADGRIRFETGPTSGNAVIGLFDAAGDCIWSWHVWVTDYDPTATAQTYSSGAVFMDRNLGALSVDPHDNATKGLHYQWGRKDPFPWTAKPFNREPDYITCSYLPGYEHDTHSPQYNGDPTEHSTVAWSVAHPTTFMGAAPDPVAGDAAIHTSWCYPPNPRLWGNAFDGTSVSTINAKSIYDPCPHGWKVPAPGAWDTQIFRPSFNYRDAGYDVSYTSSSQASTFYPFGGYLSDIYGSASFVLPELWGGTWTCTAAARRGTTRFDPAAGNCMLLIQDTAEAAYRSEPQVFGYHVRCVKE